MLILFYYPKFFFPHASQDISELFQEPYIVESIFGLTEIDHEKDQGKVLTPEIDREIDQGKVLAPRKDCKIDRDKVLGTDIRFLEKSRKRGQKYDKTGKNKKKYSKNVTVGQLFDFWKSTMK